MTYYIIIEQDDGFAVAAVSDSQTAVEVAKNEGAILIDEGPYHTFEEAQDVMLAMPNPYEADAQ